MRRVFLLLLSAVALIALVAGLAHWRLSARVWPGPRSDHFDGERFVNREPIADKSFFQVLRWQLSGAAERWPDWIASETGPPPPARVSDGGLRVTWINHATVLVQMDGVNILTDPVWSERVSPVSFAGPKRHRAPGLRFEDLPPIDLVLVSHNHYDHLDIPTLRRIAREHRAPIVVGLGNGEYLRRFDVVTDEPGDTAARGLERRARVLEPHARARVLEMDWEDTLAVRDDVRVIALPAQHWSSRTPWDRARTLWCAYVVEAPSGRVYLAGDTGYGRHFADAGRRFGPFRLVLLPIGAFLPRWFMRDNHIAPHEAVQAATDLRAATSVVMHFGTFALGDDGPRTPVDSLRAAVARLGDRAPSVRVVEHGVGYDVPPAGSR